MKLYNLNFVEKRGEEMVVGDRVVYDEDGVKHEGEIIEFLYDGLALTMKLDDGSHVTCGTRWVKKIS